MATHYAPLHITVFHFSTLCTCSYAYVLWQHTINHFILPYSVAAQCAPLQLYYILWQHSAPLHYAAYCGNTVHHFILLYSMATHYVPLLLILLQHTMHHFILLYSVTTHYAPLHTTLFCGKSVCTTSYDSILWQHTMRNFILLYSAATQ